MDKIKVVGASLHNLKDLNVEIQKKKMVLIIGVYLTTNLIIT